MSRPAKRLPLRSPIVALILASFLGIGVVAVHVGAKPFQGQVPAQLIAESTLAASGLPSGTAHVIARHQSFPPGFSLKHVHGGPGFIYVIAGTLTVSDADGTVTYNAGDFFSEPAGHVHTASTQQGAEVTQFYVLSDGAEATIPVP